MRAKDIASRLTGRMRQFRATSLGEFAVALIIFAAIGTLYLPLLLSVAAHSCFRRRLGGRRGGIAERLEHSCELGIQRMLRQASGETASFNTSASTTPTLSGTVTIASITFNPGANAYTIVNPGPFPSVLFSFKAPGSLTILVSRKPSTTRLVLQFFGNSTAGNATINNFAGSWVLFRIQLPEMRRSQQLAYFSFSREFNCRKCDDQQLL